MVESATNSYSTDILRLVDRIMADRIPGQGRMAEWSKALVLGTSHFGGAGSNPVPVISGLERCKSGTPMLAEHMRAKCSSCSSIPHSMLTMLTNVALGDYAQRVCCQQLCVTQFDCSKRHYLWQLHPCRTTFTQWQDGRAV